MELLTFTIAAGETKRFERAGRLLEIIDAPAALNIGFYDANGSQNNDMIGALSGFFSLESYSAFEVSNPGTVTQRVMLMTAAGQGGSRRAPGVVQVVDSQRSNVIDDNEWITSFTLAAPGVGLFDTFEIWNGTTDKGLTIRNLVVRSDTAQGLMMGQQGVELVGSTGNLASKKYLSTGLTPLTNLRRNTRNLSAAADVPTNTILVLNVTAGADFTVPVGGAPLVLGPSCGLRVACAIANSSLAGIVSGEAFDWLG